MSTPQKSIKYKNIEIVGLSHGGSGRQCQQHTICGESVEVGDKMLLKMGEIDVIEEVQVQKVKENEVRKGPGRRRKDCYQEVTEHVTKSEKTVKVISLKDGCMVGFVSKTIYSIYGDALNDKIVDVTKLLKLSENKNDKLRDITYNGVCHAIIIS